MSDIPNINTQAMSVLAYAVNNDAANIANADTPGYQRRETVITGDRDQIRAVTEKIVPWGQGAQTIPPEAGGDNTPQRQAWDAAAQAANADYSRDMVNLLSHQRAFEVNAAAVRAVEQTTGTLFDAFA